MWIFYSCIHFCFNLEAFLFNNVSGWSLPFLIKHFFICLNHFSSFFAWSCLIFFVHKVHTNIYLRNVCLSPLTGAIGLQNGAAGPQNGAGCPKTEALGPKSGAAGSKTGTVGPYTDQNFAARWP